MNERIEIPQRLSHEDDVRSYNACDSDSIIKEYISRVVDKSVMITRSQADCSERKVYLNFTDRPLMMIGQDNVPHILPIVKLDKYIDFCLNALVIITIPPHTDASTLTSEVDDAVTNFTQHRYNALSNIDPEHRKLSSGTLDPFTSSLYFNTPKIDILTDITGKLKTFNGFYSGALDRVIVDFMRPSLTHWVHPRSDYAVKVNLTPADDKESKVMRVSYSINDPLTQHHKAFINISGDVIEIPITRDDAKPAILTVRHEVNGRVVSENAYPLDDPKKPVRLYADKQSALDLGDANAVMNKISHDHKLERLEAEIKAAEQKCIYESKKVEVAEKKLESELRNAEIRAELEKKKLEDQKEMFDRQAKIDRERYEEAERAAKRAREDAETLRRQQQEDREHARRARESDEAAKRRHEEEARKSEKESFWRRGVIEGMKVVAAVASTILTGIGLWVKFKKG